MSENQLLRDPDIEPASDVIAEALGAAYNAYVEFIEGLKSHNIDLEWRYYTDGKAWRGKGLYRWTGVRGGQKEVTAFWLSIWDDPNRAGGFFKITVYIPENRRSEALMLPLDGENKKMIEASKQMGKRKFFPVIFDLRSDELFGAVYMLIDFRKAI
jgi:hypothetical protein